MAIKVQERPALTGDMLPLVQQLQVLFQEYGFAINDFETSTFTPVFSFATSGDLSVAYVTQVGKYWRVGPLVHFVVDMKFTPTFTTASGRAEVTGLPFASPAADPVYVFPLQLEGGAGLTYPTGRTSLISAIAAGATNLVFASLGSGVTGLNFDATDFTSGTEVTTLRVTGFYPND